LRPHEFQLGPQVSAADPLSRILLEGLCQELTHAGAHRRVVWNRVARISVLEDHVRVERRPEEEQREDQASKSENVNFFVDGEAGIKVDLLGSLVQSRCLLLDLVFDSPSILN